MIIPKGPKITFAILKIAPFWPVVSVSGFAAIYFGKNSMVSFLLGSVWLIEISLARTNSDHIL